MTKAESALYKVQPIHGFTDDSIAMIKLPVFLTQLRTILINDMKEVRIPVSIGFKKLGTSKVYRIYVIAKEFKRWRYQERQELIWRIVKQNFTQTQQNQISMIVTATPDEIADDHEVKCD